MYIKAGVKAGHYPGANKNHTGSVIKPAVQGSLKLVADQSSTISNQNGTRRHYSASRTQRRTGSEPVRSIGRSTSGWSEPWNLHNMNWMGLAKPLSNSVENTCCMYLSIHFLYNLSCTLRPCRVTKSIFIVTSDTELPIIFICTVAKKEVLIDIELLITILPGGIGPTHRVKIYIMA